MFGCDQTPNGVAGDPIKVDLPKVKTLFDDCDWRPFTSLDFPYGNTWDIEMRSKAFHNRYKKHFKGHVCGEKINDAMYIDARTIDDDVPWDETGEYITKITPQ